MKEKETERYTEELFSLMRSLGWVDMQVFLTKVDKEGCTISYTNGSGNLNARRGQVAVWLQQEEDSEVSPDK